LIDTILLDDRFVQNPQELYRRLREEAPTCEVEIFGGARGWLVTRYQDALALLKDPRITKDQVAALARYPADRVKPFSSPVLQDMLNVDPPEHTRLRRLVMRAFTSRAVERMQPVIEAIADELLDDIDCGDTTAPVDLMAHYAQPLPMQVIGELLGLPMHYSAAFRAAAVPLTSNATDEEKTSADEQMTAILGDLIDLKSQHPRDDLHSTLITASVDGNQLTRRELIAMCFLLIAAGYETTVNLIGNGMLALLSNPEQLATVRANPQLLSATVEEVLRFDGPVNIATLRFTTAEIEVNGVVIPANQLLLISLLSANHDADQFPDADRFDISRDTRGHVAFGHGIHHCLGAPLARMEGVIAIGRLIQRYDHLTLDHTEPLQYIDSNLFRGLKTLPIRLT
jgi:cytochrome P450